VADERPKSVLIVEDDVDLSSLLAMLLEQRGYSIETAGNGHEALQVLEGGIPDLILLDMKMPVMNGWEFAHEFNERHDHAAPIVVVTAAADAEHRAKEIGADGWVGKPFDMGRLLSAVGQFLES
jgi:CheY-like chemotaxis protein